MSKVKATIVFDNTEEVERGAYVDPTTTVEFDGPGWYELSNDFVWIKVSSHTKERGFAVNEAERHGYIGSPIYLGSLAEVERRMNAKL